MSDKSHENISNLMDGELEAQASRFLLKRLASDQQLSSTWERYHIIQSCLQKSAGEPLAIDIAASVSRKLREAPVEIQEEPKNWSKWLRPVAGLGIAATVAFMAVLVVQNRQVLPNGADLNPTVVTAAAQPDIEVNVPSAQLVGASRTVPAYLSRYPSLSAKESSLYNQSISERQNARPYIYIINHNQVGASQHTPPLKTQGLAD